MRAVQPYLNFGGNTEEAFGFYRSVFGGEFLELVRFRDLDDGSMPVSDEEMDKIAHVALSLGGAGVLMGSDVPGAQERPPTVGDNAYILLEADSVAEAERLFGALSEGGRVEMPLQETGWAERYAAFRDGFGVQWMVNYPGAAGSDAAGSDAAGSDAAGSDAAGSSAAG